MAHKGKYTRLLMGSSTYAYDFSGVSNSLETSFGVDMIEDTTFQATAKSEMAGDPSATITQNGYAVRSATEAENFEKHLTDAIESTTSLTVAALYMTDLDACPAYVARATNAKSMKISGKTGGLVTIQGDWPQGTGIVRGVRVWSGTISATGAQTTPGYIDLGAVGTAGGYAWLFVRAITGTATSADVLLQSDDNTGFATPATEGTFTFSTTGVVEVALSGTVDRYVRLSTSDMGGATNFTVTAIVAVSGVTY
jgi:hypothetical protein